MNRFDEGQLGKIHAAARDNVENHLGTASDADKAVFVQVECTKLIVGAIERLGIKESKEEVIAEIKKIPRAKQGRRGIERGGLIAIGGVIGGAIIEFLTRFRN